MLKKSSTRTFPWRNEWWILGISFVFLFSLLVSPALYRVDGVAQSQSFAQPAYANFAPGAHSISFEQLLGDSNGSQITHTVARWETLDMIAQNYGTTVRALVRVNSFDADVVLQQGQHVTIAYDEWVIHEVQEQRTVGEFARYYNLSLADVMSLNFIDDIDSVLEVGQELFLDIHRIEAEARGLVKKRVFEEVYVPTVEVSVGRDMQEDDVFVSVDDADALDNTDAIVADSTSSQVVIYQDPVDQVVITAEETARQQELARQQREEQRRAEEQRYIAAQEAQVAQVAAEEARQEPQTEAPAEPAPTPSVQEQPASSAATSCGESACSFNGRCYDRPKNAACLVGDPSYAWACQPGYRESGGSCIDQATFERQQEEARLAKEEADRQARERAAQETAQAATNTAPAPQPAARTPQVGIVASRHFNPRNEWFGGQWFAWGHCTYYAAYRRRKDGNPVTWRGNANAWLRNAAAAGVPTGQTPRVGSLVVFGEGPNWWRWYGHVAYVSAVESGRILIDEMNFNGRWVHTTRWVALEGAGILGYIYQTQ